MFSSFLFFSGVTVHCSSTIPSLGQESYDLLTRFRERASAEMLLDTLLGTLESLRLAARNIRGITTDGASVMLKLGRLLQQAVQRTSSTVEGGEVSEVATESGPPFFHMLCMVHTLHLAVLDTFKHSVAEGNDEVAETDAEEIASWNFVDPDAGKFHILESMSCNRRC